MLMFHFYRCSSNFKRLIYKEEIPFESAKVDYSEFNRIEGKDGENLKALQEYPTNGEGLLDKNIFTDLEDELKRLLDKMSQMDNDSGIKSDFEKELEEALRMKFNQEIGLLEHNYSAVAIEALGNSDKRITELQEGLKTEFQDFTYQLEMEIYQETIRQDKKEYSTPEEKEGAKEAARAAKIMLIDDAIGLDGMGEYILATNPESVIDSVFADPLPQNPKEFNKRLAKALNEDVLEKAAKKMLDEIDSEQTKDQVIKNKEYFKQAIEDSIQASGGDPAKRINYEIGEDETERLIDVLSQRFKVMDGLDGKRYVVDLLGSSSKKSNGKIKVSKDKDFSIYDAEEFAKGTGVGSLKNICDNEYKTAKDLKRQEKAIKKRERKDTKMEHELLENIFRGKWSRLDEIRGLKPLKKRVGKNKGDFKNKSWEQVLTNAQELKNKTNEFLNPKMEDENSSDEATQGSETPETAEPTPESVAREMLTNYHGSDFKALWDLLVSLLNEAKSLEKDDSKGEHITKKVEEIGVAANEEGAENITGQINAAKEAYLKVIQEKSPKLKEMIDIAIDPNSTAFEEGENADLKIKFRSQRYEAIVEHIEETMCLKEEEFKITKIETDRIIIEKNGIKMFMKNKLAEDANNKYWSFEFPGIDKPILITYDEKIKRSGAGPAATQAYINFKLMQEEENPQKS